MSEGHGDKGCDVRLMMVAASFMFTIVSLRKQEAGQEKAREPGPPACKQSKIEGATESEKRSRDKGHRERGG